MTKYVFVTGGVVSGLGKGIVAASLGRLLKQHGYRVGAQKMDPYMNLDPGTMNPLEHGEVFVTQDGLETDLDLGHYERFINTKLTKYSNLTSGKVYWTVLNKERNGEYLGKTVQIVPHVTNEIKDFILKNAEASHCDIMITEIGGTIGDIESQPFLEAIRQFMYDVGRENCALIHVCLVPFISGSNEYKSKPTQHSVKELQSLGLHPDIICTRTDSELTPEILHKIAMFCNVKEDCVINDITLPELYECPLYLHKQGLDKVLLRELHLKQNKADLSEWKKMVKQIHSRRGEVTIALVGKYTKLHDAYISVVESLKHASYENGVQVNIDWVNSEEITEDTVDTLLKNADGILVPGGFGDRGIEGKVLAAKYAREKKVPYLGICLGMQIAVIEFARHVAKIPNATSREFGKEGDNFVIDLMPDQRGVIYGGTMRLGGYPCVLTPGSKFQKLYQKDEIIERHRHRYEFNNDFKEQLISSGLKIAGQSPNGEIVECIELDNHPYFVACQFHPEFLSRPNHPHPLFSGLIASAKDK